MTPQVMELMRVGERPVCKLPLGFPTTPGATPVRLAKAIQDLQHHAVQAKVQVEIAVPDESE